MDSRPTFKAQNYNTPRKTIEENLGDPGLGDDVLDITPKAEA